MGKIIKISQNKLKKIISENVKKVIYEMSTSFIDSIDLSKIDKKLLKKYYIDLRLVPTVSRFGDILSDVPYLKEDVDEIMEPDDVVNSIKNKYHLPDTFVFKMEAYNKVYIYIITACVGINDKLIEDDMLKMGYFVGSKRNRDIGDGMTYQIQQFEPTSQKQIDETDNIKNNNDFLYHWTPEYNLNDILSHGLVPKHENKKFYYPNRIYFILSNTSTHDIDFLGQQLCLVNNIPQNNGNYVLLKINVKTLDDDVRFFYDPNSQIAVYTEQKIPNDKIEIVRRKNFKTE